MNSTPILDATVTRLDSLQFFIEQALLGVKAQMEESTGVATETKVSAIGALVNLIHLIQIANEIAVNLEPALRGVARTVDSLLAAGRIDQLCAEEIFSQYERHLGEREADQLFSDAFGK